MDYSRNRTWEVRFVLINYKSNVCFYWIILFWNQSCSIFYNLTHQLYLRFDLWYEKPKRNRILTKLVRFKIYFELWWPQLTRKRGWLWIDQPPKTKLYSINLRIRNVVLFIHILSSNQINVTAIEKGPGDQKSFFCHIRNHLFGF